jgi:hypothetical protein
MIVSPRISMPKDYPLPVLLFRHFSRAFVVVVVVVV